MSKLFPNVHYDGELVMRHVGDDEWELTQPVHVRWTGGHLTVPPGFVNDLASVPQIFRSIIPVVGDQNLPAVVHDYCYVYRWRSRIEADKLFLAGLKAAGCGWLKRHVMYLAVRIGGRGAWEDDD